MRSLKGLETGQKLVLTITLEDTPRDGQKRILEAGIICTYHKSIHKIDFFCPPHVMIDGKRKWQATLNGQAVRILDFCELVIESEVMSNE